MIEFRAFFKWREATPQEAYDFCNSFMASIQTTHIREEKIKMVNKNHLRGITYEELEKEVKNMYTIDTKSDDKYFIVINPEGFKIKISKASNTLDQVKKLIGLINIKEII